MKAVAGLIGFPVGGAAAVGSLIVGTSLKVGTQFTSPFDTAVYIAPANRANPTNDSEALYVQHRVSGDLGGHVHDAMAAELRITTGSNAGFLNALETTIVITGVTALNDVRGTTQSTSIDPAATGNVVAWHGTRIQSLAALPGGFTITTQYGLYVEDQNRGANNYAIWTNLGQVRFGGGVVMLSGAAATSRDIQFQTAGVNRWIERVDGTAETGANAGSDYALVRRADDGSNLGNALTVTRSTGAGQFPGAMVFGGLVTLAGGSPLLATTNPLTNGSGASVGTLTNSPAAGNPTKWLAVNDGGTIRQVPSW